VYVQGKDVVLIMDQSVGPFGFASCSLTIPSKEDTGTCDA